MITRRTKIQLVVFAIITLLGVSFVGARYAQLDRLVRPDSYPVVAHFADSGGIFSGAEVSYRGVKIGRVSSLTLTKDGVDVHMDIDNKWTSIPADTLAVVDNRSAVGEQYVDLQPKTDDGPYLDGDSTIPVADTRTPIQTDTLLTDITDTFGNIDRGALRTTVLELGKAFAGTGQDLQRIIDDGTDFIKTADANFETTTKLINDSNTVLNTQIVSESAIRNFSQQLALFSDTLASSDPDLRKIIDDGSFAANQLRTFIEDNRIDLGELLGELVTTGKIVVKNLPGIQQLLVIFPYVVEGAFTVVAKSPDTGLYDAHFGAIITNTPVCTNGYQSTNERSPSDGSNAPMNEQAHCADPPTATNPRGAQNAPTERRAPANYDPNVVASYDPESGKLTWGDHVDPTLSAAGSVAPRSLGEESWKWLYAQPLTGR